MHLRLRAVMITQSHEFVALGRGVISGKRYVKDTSTLRVPGQAAVALSSRHL
jgi:hypothetical protein